MAEIKSLLTQTTADGKKIEPMAPIASIGSLLGLIAGIIGLIAGGAALLPLPDVANFFNTTLRDFGYYPLSAAFMGLLAVSLLLQAYGSKEIRIKTGASIAQINWLAFLIALLIAINVIGAGEATSAGQIGSLVVNLATLTSLFIVFWQIGVTVFIDTSKTWIGFLAGVLNILVFPVMALGVFLGPGLVYASYILLIAGQFMGFIYNRSPPTAFREYARSPDKAKFAFGLIGFLSFVIGTAAVFMGPIQEVEGVTLWHHWGTLASANDPLTSPALIMAFLAMMLSWIFLAPRLGARELKAAHIGEDIVKGGIKAFMILLAFIGIMAAGQAGTGLEEAVGGTGFFLNIAGPAIMFFMGALYISTTDVLTGLPLVVASVFMIVAPFTLIWTVTIPWIIILISQFLLMVETKIRGLTAYALPWATVIVTIGASALLIGILLGAFGVGPPAIWPTNRWFNFEFFAGVPVDIQAPTILAIPILALVIRNVTLTGFAHRGGYGNVDVLGGITAIFVLLIPMIAGNDDLTHMALTAAAILFALYALSLVIVLSLNLSIAGDIEQEGHMFEGQILRMTTIVGIVAGAVIAVIALATFSGFPDAFQVSFVITMLVILVVGVETLSIIGWLIAGVRLGLFTEGWKFDRTPGQ